jgi:hypothetical protein
VAGGGVPGKGVGIALITTIEVGVITGECQVFTDIFITVGEMISGIIAGEGNRGNISGYITAIFMTIGVTGKEPGTGTMADLVGTVAVDLDIPAEGILLVGTEVVDLDLGTTEAEDLDPDTMAADLDPVCMAVVDLDPVVTTVVDLDLEVVDLGKVNLVEEALVKEDPVYNWISIIRKMEGYSKDRLENKAAKIQTAA